MLEEYFDLGHARIIIPRLDIDGSHRTYTLSCTAQRDNVVSMHAIGKPPREVCCPFVLIARAGRVYMSSLMEEDGKFIHIINRLPHETELVIIDALYAVGFKQ